MKIPKLTPSPAVFTLAISFVSFPMIAPAAVVVNGGQTPGPVSNFTVNAANGIYAGSIFEGETFDVATSIPVTNAGAVGGGIEFDAGGVSTFSVTLASDVVIDNTGGIYNGTDLFRNSGPTRLSARVLGSGPGGGFNDGNVGVNIGFQTSLGGTPVDMQGEGWSISSFNPGNVGNDYVGSYAGTGVEYTFDGTTDATGNYSIFSTTSEILPNPAPATLPAGTTPTSFYDGLSWTFTTSDGSNFPAGTTFRLTFDGSSVPEPSSASLLLGAFGIGLFTRRRR